MARSENNSPEKALNDDQFVGYIIKLASVAEFRLDMLIAHYFSPGFEKFEFLQLVGERLTFSAKIEIFAKLQFHRKLKSQENLLRILRGLSFLRNKLAHEYIITGPKLQRIQDNHDAMRFVLADRKGRSRIKHQLEVCFTHLWNSIDKKRKASHART